MRLGVDAGRVATKVAALRDGALVVGVSVPARGGVAVSLRRALTALRESPALRDSLHLGDAPGLGGGPGPRGSADRRDSRGSPGSPGVRASAPGPGAGGPYGGAEAVVVTADLPAGELEPVGVLRIGAPAHAALGPLAGWPERVRGASRTAVVRGGHTLTGFPLAPLDRDAVRAFAAEAGRAGLTSFAVTAAGSPTSAAHELAAAALIAAEVPGARITLSYEFGRPGLRERENSAVLNAALRPAAERLADEAGDVLARAGIGAPLCFARNAGGLVGAEYYRRYPVVAHASAAGSALAGAVRLAGVDSAIVADASPREVRLGVVEAGRPRPGPGGGADLPGLSPGGVPLNMSLPMLRRAVLPAGREELLEGVAALRRAAPGLPSLLVGGACRKAGDAGGADRAGERPDVAAALGPDWTVPAGAELAGAVGAAAAQVSAEVERIVYATGRAELEHELADARDEALARVVSAGAAPGSARVASVSRNPLSYLPDGLYRVRVVAAGTTG
ncbi:hydantoinase/oxoprolinase N-terminal domain-containing protein [Bailinhaonella thermotolerans]|uniref:Hydantoinase/oxoprolinase N-terminal domain-containing protein n=1 Tax=Bailinhaonella thermotolerans TaxID=1070861 RepID=A0A3A4A9K5_9ACTN|nr:hydantoinase/oxoprolinase N-terminal domain-containing protein [Bailinhaonella thermotolerans]RJL24719.1 hypothetical protein D5H75_28390 [Bailinhaonella thermotolerans]